MKKLFYALFIAPLAICLLTTLAVSATPTPGGTMKVILHSEAVAFGYPPKIAAMDRDYASPFFDRLLMLGDDGNYAPRLATSWEITPDGRSITFTLRKGVKFHDGTDFNAAAAKFNFDALIPPKGKTLKGVSSVEALDDYTLKVNLAAFNNLILFQIASAYECYFASPTAIEKNGKEWAEKHPVGTGPFKFVSYERGVGMNMVKNEDYWAKGLPYLDKIEIHTIVDEMTQMTAFKAGEANAVYGIKVNPAGQLRDAGYNLKIAPKSLFSLSFDTKHNKILADKRVRMAIEYAIDKEAICNGPGLGLYTPCYQIVDTKNLSYNKECPPRKYDPEKAKKLLAEAGYPDGITFTCNFVNKYWREGIVAIQAYLAEVGITMKTNFITIPVFGKIRALGQIDPGTGCQMPLLNSSNSLFVMDFYFRSDSTQFPYVERPAGSDALIAKAKQARDLDGMYSVTREISKLLYDEATIVPLWTSPQIIVMDKSVQDDGWFINNDSSNNEFGRATWLKN